MCILRDWIFLNHEGLWSPVPSAINQSYSHESISCQLVVEFRVRRSLGVLRSNSIFKLWQTFLSWKVSRKDLTATPIFRCPLYIGRLLISSQCHSVHRKRSCNISERYEIFERSIGQQYWQPCIMHGCRCCSWAAEQHYGPGKLLEDGIYFSVLFILRFHIHFCSPRLSKMPPLNFAKILSFSLHHWKFLRCITEVSRKSLDTF